MANYYETLGVDKSATKDQLKTAYRNLAKKYHPDMYSTASEEEKKKAEEKFKEINHAYEVLSDDDKRAAYDTYGNENGPMGGGAGGTGGTGGFRWSTSGEGFDMDDIFSTIFSGFTGGAGRRSARANRAIRGEDIVVELNITFEEAAFGCEKEVKIKRTENCKTCGGTGAKDANSVKTCTKCGGKGVVNVTQRTVFGQVSTQTVCPDCKGKGKIITDKCTACGGKGKVEQVRTVKVNVPAGIADGQQMSYYNEGEAGTNGGENGSLIVVVRVKKHKLFERRDYNLYVNVPITFTEAVLGGEIDVPTLNGPIKYEIPEGTQTGTVFRIKNKGVKYLRKEVYGDLYITVVVETPKKLSREQKKALEALAKTFDQKQYQKIKEYKDNLK